MYSAIWLLDCNYVPKGDGFSNHVTATFIHISCKWDNDLREDMVVAG